MSKRVDHDATQEVSASMLVPDKKPPVYPNVPKNDASMWLSAPVSADDFVSGPKKKPELRGNRSFVIIVFLALVVLLVGGAAFAWYAFLRPAGTQTSTVANTPPPAPVDDKAIAPAPASDAGVVVAAADAAVVATIDAGAAPGALVVDAVSAADPAPKKTTKKRPATKKKAVKKKTASTRKRR